MARRRIPTLSLFTGAGGLDIGFHLAGFDLVGCVEIEEMYCRTLAANIGRGKFFGSGTTIHCQDIRDFDAKQHMQDGIKCVIGGPPCQTFSAAGRRAGGVIGISDPRGKLFQAYCDILEALRPNAFVFENVYGLPGANGGGPWRAIHRAFSELGYTLCAEVLDAADYGVPQHRERLFVVGFRDGAYEFPMPTNGPDSDGGPPLVSVLDAVADLQDRNEPAHTGLGGLYGHLLPLVPEGLNYAYFTAEMGHPEPVFAWRSKFHDLLYKANRHEPCRTIKARPGKFTGPFHWKNRHFTVSELKRLQSFPDDYVILGNYGKVLEQIGNSVPPRLAHVLATSVREQILTPTKSLTFPIRQPGFKSTFRQRQREKSHAFKQIARKAIREKYEGVGARVRRRSVSSERYYVRANGFFDHTKYAKQPKRLSPEESAYRVALKDAWDRLDIRVDTCDQKDGVLRGCELYIDGLSKYLGRIDSVHVSASVQELHDLFPMWCVLEEALTQRSKFFTLIDIYGHYANRGDTVRIRSEIKASRNTATVRALRFFGQSENCGAFLSLKDFSLSTEMTQHGVEKTIKALRAVRFDVRTSNTHPIIGRDRILCTYPFPLLSAKALVQSRAEVEIPGSQHSLSLA